MTVHIPGYSSLTGKPETIVKLMETANLMDATTGDDYIESVVQTIWRCYEKKITITGDTYQERAESLLRELEKIGFINITE